MIKVVAEVDKKHPETQFNDGKCDPDGRLWAGIKKPKFVHNNKSFAQFLLE